MWFRSEGDWVMFKMSAAIAGLAILVSISAAEAQLFGPRPEARTVGPSTMPDAMDPAMCDQMASIPNAPMSAEACRSMMSMQQSMQAASSDPNAVRPGDENLSCDQIYVEMRATGGPMISQETAERNRVSADATMALMQKQNAEMKGFVAGQVAMGVGAAAVGMLPGGGFATQAIVAAQQAQAQNFAARQAQEAAPVRAQSSAAIAATGNEMSQALQSNPRYARLMQLVVDKSCPPPPDLPPPTP